MDFLKCSHYEIFFSFFPQPFTSHAETRGRPDWALRPEFTNSRTSFLTKKMYTTDVGAKALFTGGDMLEKAEGCVPGSRG